MKARWDLYNTPASTQKASCRFPPSVPHLAAAGIESHAFLHEKIAGSGLSKMHYPEVDSHAFYGLTDLWTSLRHLLETDSDSRRYVWAYFGDVDFLAHRYGPNDDRVSARFEQFIRSLQG